MGEEVHYIPVGFDFQRLVQPLSKDNFNPDRVVLYYSESVPEREKEAELAEKMVEKVENACRNVISTDVEVRPLQDIFDYTELFKTAYEAIENEIANDNEIFINISSMPRTVAFAFATAGNTHIAQKPDLRSRIHPYYVSPDEYLIIEAIERFESHIDFLEQTSENEIEDLDNQLESLKDIVGRLNEGITEGVRKISGKNHVKFAAAPVFGVQGIQRQILQILDYHDGTIVSISELARKHGDLIDVDGDDASHKKKIRYHINENLDPQGLVEIDTSQKSHQVSLSQIGEMWAKASESLAESDFR